MPALSLVATVFPAASQAQSGVEPARPIERAQPEYPDECSSTTDQTVDVIYDITSQGTTENIRVEQSTDSCFENAAIEAVREWRFEPRTVNGTPSPQYRTRTRVVFETSGLSRNEIEKLLRNAPGYPAECKRGAMDVEYVTLRYDVSEAGETENIRVVKSTYSCFDEHSAKFISNWRYMPRHPKADVEVTLTYELE